MRPSGKSQHVNHHKARKFRQVEASIRQKRRDNRSALTQIQLLNSRPGMCRKEITRLEGMRP